MDLLGGAGLGLSGSGCGETGDCGLKNPASVFLHKSKYMRPLHPNASGLGAPRRV